MRSLPSCLVSVWLIVSYSAYSQVGHHGGTAAAKAQTDVVTEYGKLPLSFEPNQGQTDRRVEYLSRGDGYSLFLTPAEAVLALRKTAPAAKQLTSLHHGSKESSQPRTAAGAALGIELLGANLKAAVKAEDELLGKSNYFIGNDPRKWRTNVPNYAKVRYEGIYPGVDLLYYGNQRRLEYDFVVAPGADPKIISLGFDGAKRIRIDKRTGDLILRMAAGEIRLQKPNAYQLTDEKEHARQAKHQSLDVRYVLKGNREAAFEVASYDRSRPLVIDPVLVYSTYLGSNGTPTTNGASFDGIAVDSSGNAYVAGQTGAGDYPTTPGAYRTTFVGTPGGTCTFGSGSFLCQDVVVSKLNPAGTALLYSTFVGGTNENFATGLAIDASGNAYVTGATSSTDFPVVNPLPAPNNALQGAYDGFAFKLNAAGSALDYSTYLGASAGNCVNGQGCTQGTAIAVDASGNAYVTGWSQSSNFATTPNAYQTSSLCPGCATAVVSKLSFTTTPAPTLTLAYSTYLGAGGDLAFGIALDSSNNVYLTGYSIGPPNAPSGIPVKNPIPNACMGTCGTSVHYNAYVAKLNPGGNGAADLIYSSYLGGSGEDRGDAIALDSSGNAYLTGTTNSPDFPATPGAFQTSYASSGSVTCPSDVTNANVPCYDAFVTKINSAASAIVYSTYLGGNDYDRGQGIAVDSLGHAYVAGFTSSANFPVMKPIQTAQAAANGTGLTHADAFVSELNDAGSALIYSTYLGGTYGSSGAAAIAVDGAGDAYVAGDTFAGGQPQPDANFAVTAGAYQTSCGPPGLGRCFESIGFVSKISPITLSSGGFVFGNQVGGFGLSFGNQPLNTTSAPQSVSLNNGSYAVLNITNVQISGPNSNQFAASNNTCSSSVAAGSTCSISVTFKPTASGVQTAALVLTDNAGGVAGTQQTIPLTGGAQTITQPLSPTQLNTFSFNGNFNYQVQYPAGTIFSQPETMTVTATPTSPANYQQRVANTPFAGTQCVLYSNAGGNGTASNCQIMQVSCNPGSCPFTGTGQPPNCGGSGQPPCILVKTSYDSPQVAFPCPAYLTDTDFVNDWTNIFTDFSLTRVDPTTKGHTNNFNSEFVAINGVCPSISIDSPASNGVYQQNSTVPSSYTCADQPNVSVSCNGPVASGSPFDTSTPGSHSFTVMASDSKGKTSTTSVNYLVVASADVAIGKFANDKVKTGTNLTYAIGVVNFGPGTAFSVVVTDPVPVGTSFVSAGFAKGACTFSNGKPICSVGSGTACSFSNNTVTCNIGNLDPFTFSNPSGAGIKLVVKATAPTGTTITNTATVGAANPDPNTGNNSSTVMTRVTNK